MNWEKRKMLVFWTMLVSFSFFILPSFPFAQTPRQGGILRLSVNHRVTTLNPLKQINTPEWIIGEMMYSGLTRLNTNMEPLQDLATSWTPNADVREWTFALRKGVKFQTLGTEMTSADVVASFKAILDKDIGSPARKSVGPISEVVAVDRHTVKFILSSSYADLPVALTHYNARIMPAEILQSDMKKLETQGYGTGPFKLASFEPGRILRVERNPNYFIAGRPYLDGIEQILYPDLNAEVAALINGETDMIMMVGETDFKRVEKTPGIKTVRTPSGKYYCLVLRLDQKPFNDIRVRKALQLAIDRQALLDIVLEGIGRLAYDNPISSEYAFHKDTGAIKRDIVKAKQLLSEAGYPNGLKLTLYCSNRPPGRTTLGVAVKEMTRPAGFDIDVQTVPYDTYLANIWMKANFYVGLFGMSPTEDGVFKLSFTTDAPWNDSQWNNAKFDGLINKAQLTVNRTERAKLYAEAQTLMANEVPYVIPFFMDQLSASRNYVNNVSLHPRGGMIFIDQIWFSEGAPKRR